MNLLVEEWGGDYQSQDISAKTGLGIDELLEKILLVAELLELQANPDRRAIGTILEASLDKGRGYVTKALVQTGTLEIGDPIVAGEHSGKVKAMFNERGKRIKIAGPSTPVLVLGLSGAPQAGERFKEELFLIQIRAGAFGRQDRARFAPGVGHLLRRRIAVARGFAGDLALFGKRYARPGWKGRAVDGFEHKGLPLRAVARQRFIRTGKQAQNCAEAEPHADHLSASTRSTREPMASDFPLLVCSAISGMPIAAP